MRRILIDEHITKSEKQAICFMTQGLFSIRAWYDAGEVLAVKRFPSNPVFKLLLETNKRNLKQLKIDSKNEQGQDNATIELTSKRGRVDRVAFPWIVPEEFTRSKKAIKTKFEGASSNAVIGPSSLGNSVDGSFGVFAQQAIPKGQSIVLDKSMLTDFNLPGGRYCSACCESLEGEGVAMSCCTARFCNEKCKAEASNSHHRILCGKDFSWLYDACKNADPVFNEMIPIIMVKVFAAAIQANASPLKIASVGTMQPDYEKNTLSYFKIFDNIIAPIKVLQTLGVNVFTDVRFDSWAIQTLFIRIENNKQGVQVGKRTHCGINPLFSMFNHNCNPSATWHARNGHCGPIEVASIRDIQNGEEICVSYIEVYLSETERRERIRAHIGKRCICARCVQERAAAAGESGVEAFDIMALVQRAITLSSKNLPLKSSNPSQRV